MKKEDFDIEELTYEISILLEGVLYFAGVKKEKLKEAANLYVEMVDDILDKNPNLDGVDEVILVVKELKKINPNLFK